MELTYEPEYIKKAKTKYGSKVMFILARCYLDAAGIEIPAGQSYDAAKIARGLSKLLHQFKDPDRVMEVIREAGDYFNSKGLSWTPEAVWRDWEMIQSWKAKEAPLVLTSKK